MIQSHFLHLLVFTILISVFFSFLTKENFKDRLKVGLILAVTLIVVSLLISYLLYPFPR